MFFLVPDDFRAFMRSVVGYLDAPGGDKLLDAEDAFQDHCGYGGRVDGATAYRFVYLTLDGIHRWTITVDEVEIRAIADGLQIEANGERSELVRTRRREPTGDPLLIWGAYNDDALMVASLDDLVAALDTLRLYAFDKPRILRMWSSSDDQLVAAVWRDACALYVIESVDGYATSTGDHQRTDSFEVLDHDGRPLLVPQADCVAWDRARNAILQFVDHGNLGPEIRIEGRIPSVLLMMGDVDRKAALAVRPDTPTELAASSLGKLIESVPLEVEPADEVTQPVEVEAALGPVELAKWARRLLDALHTRELIELGPGPNLDEISYQLGGLLQAHALDAEHSLETADWLANEIGSVRGIAKLFATGGDLQVAIRRSRDL